MKAVISLCVLLWCCALPARAAIVFLSYQLSSPDDLADIAVGQTVHLDLHLAGLSPQTWDGSFVFNMAVSASDAAAWSNPFNVSLSPDLTAASLSFSAGALHMIDTGPVPVTTTTDFVLGFDITALAVNAGVFAAGVGGDLFSRINESDLYFTRSDGIAYEVQAAGTVPAPSTLVLSAPGLVALGIFRRRARRTPLPPGAATRAG